MELWLVRHGETEWSASGKHTSFTDVPLTEKGREQADGLLRMLRPVRFDAVLVSPRVRARETCALAGKIEGAIVEPNLQEWNYGEFEGKTTPEIRTELNEPGWNVWDSEIVGGETVGAVGARADAVIARAAGLMGTDGRVALFAHAHILRILAARWLGMEARGGRLFALSTASVSVLGMEREQRVVQKWNLTAV